MDFIKEGRNIRLLHPDSFRLADTLDCGQAFRFFKDDNDVWSGIVSGRQIRMKEDGEDILFYDICESDFTELMIPYFTLDIDYAAIKRRFSSDKHLKAAMEYANGIRILRQDKWECVCSFIISQNNNIPRIKGIIERLCESFGNKCEGGYAFPPADRIAALSAEDLSPLRAGFRTRYILDAAAKFANGEINLELVSAAPLDDARQELMKIKGVGPKVADCALLFSFGRFDAFPQDVWIKRATAELYPNGLPDCFGEYAGIAQQYLFHYMRNKQDSH